MIRYVLIALWFINTTSCMNQKCTVSDQLVQKSATELSTVLKNEKKFIKVHAAEFLLWLHLNRDTVYQTFINENEQYGTEPKYRIGIWRVLAQASADEQEKNQWIEKIMNVFIDGNATDRIHAAETLAKLQTSPLLIHRDITLTALQDTNNILGVYTRWSTSYTSDKEAESNKQIFIHNLFNDTDILVRKVSAYVLLKSQNLTPSEWTDIAKRALSEPDDSQLKQTYLNTAFVAFAGNDHTTHENIKTQLLKGWQQFTAEQRIALSQSLAIKGDCSDIKILESILNNEHATYEINSPLAADVRAFAAYAILAIHKRTK